MISEPELTGGFDDGPPADVVADFDHEPRPAPRPRPPWVWVAGAVLVTSAAWAVGAYAYDRGHDDRPELHGYRLGASPCAGSTFKPLTDAVRAASSARAPDVDGGPMPAVQHSGTAVDRTRCYFAAEAPFGHGGTTSYVVSVSVDLHKKVDPRVEFDDEVRLDGGSLSIVDDVVAVPELGDEAYFLTGGNDREELKVLHGGAVFDVNLNASTQANVSQDTLNGLDGGTSPVYPDLTQYRPQLIQVTRNIMSALRKN